MLYKHINTYGTSSGVLQAAEDRRVWVPCSEPKEAALGDSGFGMVGIWGECCKTLQNIQEFCKNLKKKCNELATFVPLVVVQYERQGKTR